MPELPEVETFARALKPELVGQTIISADLRWARTLAIPSPSQFKKQIIGQEIVDVSRRAKYLVIYLKDYKLLIHLRMSGDLIIRQGKIKAGLWQAEGGRDQILALFCPFLCRNYWFYRRKNRDSAAMSLILLNIEFAGTTAWAVRPAKIRWDDGW